jgi:hypothetical protein
MSWRNLIVDNEPKVELHSITTLVAGNYKSGKTRLYKEVTELHYSSPDEALLLAFEPGYETWKLKNIVPLHKFEMKNGKKDLANVWEVFKKEVVPGLVQEASENKKIKLIGTDTADKAIDACTAWVLRDRAKKYGVSKLESLQQITEISKGQENGWNTFYDELKDPFDTLKNAGYGLFHLAWVKEKETTLYDGMKYNSLELMMNATAKKVFESQASLICCLFNEVTVTDKEGNELEENLKDKRGREKGSNFHETKTVMVFRPTQYISIAGGRFTNLPEEPVEYSAKKFLEVFENAVKGQLDDDDDIEQLREKQEEEREEQAKEIASIYNNEVSAKSLIKDIAAKIKGLQSDKSVIDEKVKPKLKEIIGSVKYQECDDINKLTEVLEYLKTL